MKSAKWVGLALLTAVTVVLWIGFGKQPALYDLAIIGGGREAHFRVELAESRSNLQHGLMDRKTLPDDAGMLFYLGNERTISMWMKDTLVPLDMLFIAKNGRVVKIKENATPESEKMINSGQPVIAVLEIKGGTAGKLQIKIGDMVICPPVLVEKSL